MIAFIVPVRTVSLTNVRMHWAAKAKVARDQRNTTRLVWRILVDSPALPVVVTLTRVAPRALDDDNLRAALKHVRDQIAEELGADDRDPRIEWVYAQGRGEPRAYAVRVEIETVAEAGSRRLDEALTATVLRAAKAATGGFVADRIMPMPAKGQPLPAGSTQRARKPKP